MCNLPPLLQASIFKRGTKGTIHHVIQCVNSLESSDFSCLIISNMVGAVNTTEHEDRIAMRMF